MKKRSRIEKLRAPFVATVIGGGLMTLGGCGLFGDCPPGVTCNPPEPPPSCPANAPDAGERCPEHGLECEYDWCATGYPTVRAECSETRTWSISRVSCNPPLVSICPPEAPAETHPCERHGEACQYETCDADGGVKTEALCGEDGGWSMSETPCEPSTPETDGGE